MFIEFRVLRPADQSVLEHVAPEVFDHPVEPRLVAEFLVDPRHHLVVALDAGVVIGFVSAVDYLHPDKSAQLWINELGVAPTHRRLGVGHKLMEKIFEVGRELGCREAWVGTEPGNRAAQRLYESLPERSASSPFVLYEFKL